MPLIRSLLLLVGMSLLASMVQAQVRLDGQVHSSVYARENLAGNQQWDAYQGLLLHVRPSVASPFSFKTNVQLARRGDPAEWEEKIYNTYLDWRKPGAKVQMRLGRQFLYKGVISGSADALLVQAKPTDKLDLALVAGSSVAFDRKLELQSWDDGGLLGAYLGYKHADPLQVNLSYFQRIRSGELAWQQAGLAVTGVLKKALYYQARIDYNILRSNYQGMRYRLTYQHQRSSIFGEVSSQNPRILEDSFFNIFEMEAYNQLRGGVSHEIGSYLVGAQYLFTAYAEDEYNHEVLTTIGKRWGTLGVVFQTGYGGERIGLYADVRYPLLPNLMITAHSSYFDYERRSVAINEEATAFSGGLRYQPFPSLSLQAEVQESMNNRYDNDLRGLVRIHYVFGTKRRGQ